MFNETEFTEFALPFLATALSTKEKPVTADSLRELFLAENGQREIQNLFGIKRKEIKSEGYKEAEGKTQKALNKLAKEQFGVETEAASLADTITAIKEGFTPEGGTGGADLVELTEKQIKQHPLFILTEKAKTDAEKALKDKETEFDTRLSTELGKRVSTLTLQQQAENALANLKAKLPGHEGQKALAVSAYKQAFEGIEQKKVGDTVYYYDRDGNRLEDAMGTPLNWDALARQTAEKFFELEGPDRSSPGANPAGSPAGSGNAGGNGGSVVLTPKTMAELNKVLETPTIKLEDKTAAKAYYQANGTDL